MSNDSRPTKSEIHEDSTGQDQAQLRDDQLEAVNGGWPGMSLYGWGAVSSVRTSYPEVFQSLGSHVNAV
jgi:hypothetical protein